MRRAVIVSSVLLLVAAGCAAIAGIEETTTITSGADATVSSDATGEASDAALPDADSSLESDADIIIPPVGDPDAALPDEDGGSAPDGAAPCILGSKTAYVPAVSGVVVDVCRASDALSQGGGFAGLDCHGTGVHDIGPKGVTACVGIDYGTPNLATATVRLSAVAEGCLYTCYAGYCGEQIAAHVYAGTGRTIDTWKYVGTAQITRSAANYKFTLPSGNWKVIGVCRSGHGAANDDVAVDGISATCR